MPTANLRTYEEITNAGAKRERTCVPGDHVEQIVRNCRLKSALDFREFRNAAVVHELKEHAV